MKGLECAINVPEGVTDDLWLVAGGGASSFTVKVNLAEGDLVRVKAPADWNAKLSEYVAGTTGSFSGKKPAGAGLGFRKTI